MIPLRDDQPTRTFPLVTLLLIAANLLVYLAQQTVPNFTESFSMVPFEVTHHQDLAGHVLRDSSGQVAVAYGVAPHPLWLTIFSAMFLHAGLLHIGGNMLYLWIFGNNVEDALGKARFLLFYLVCGFAAALMQIGADPNSVIPTLGASGAIAGVLGAYLILYPDALVWSIVPVVISLLLPVRAFWVIVVWVVYDILPAFFDHSRGGGVAYFAHLGGFVAGFVIITLLGGKRLVVRQSRRAASR